ncbi:MAG TPA: thioredoxin domain-containing protein [Terriglobia bacterium]|nr:thioredoxin domain-containing protein [Terriglobia bacterium]
MNAKFYMWRLAVCACLFTGVACAAQGQTKPVAVINGESITEADLQKAAAPELDKLDLKQKQFMATLERDRKGAVEDALEELVNRKLLELEAKKRSVSVDDLLRTEVQEKVEVPSEEVIRKFYEDNKSVIKGSFIETALEIRNYLMQRNQEAAFGALISRLRKDYAYKSMLEPARAKVEIAGHPVKGPANAPVTIVEFSDFECPYCLGIVPTLKRVEETYKDKVRIVYRQFPLNAIHPNAQKAAEASLCANEQNKFWQLHDAMFADQRNLKVDDLKAKAAALSMNAAAFATCLDSGKHAAAVRTSLEEGNTLGVDGTPALFINGRYLGGNQPYDSIVKVIEDELARLGK